MKKYYHGLDGLRTIAIIGVILYHLLPDIFRGGFLGVPLFFSISGFLITAPLIEEKTKSNCVNYKSFYLKRIKRIYPSLLVMIIIVGLIAILIEKDYKYLMEAGSSLLGVNNLWQLSNKVSYFEQFKDLNLLKHLWSLSVELQFYLMMPFIVQYLVNKKNGVTRLREFLVIATLLSWLIMMSVFLFKGNSTVYYLFTARFFSFSMGSLVSILYFNFDLKRTFSRSIITIILMLGCFVLISDYKASTYLIGMFIFSLLGSLVIWAVVSQPKIDQLLSNKFFEFIGIRSYDIFLWYYPVLALYQKYAKWDGSLPVFHISLQLLIILVLSNFTYYLSQYMVGKRGKKNNFKLIIALECLFLVGMVVVTSNFMLNNLKETQLKTITNSTEKEVVKEKNREIVTKETTQFSTTEKVESKKEVNNLLFLGDSVMLGAEEKISEIFNGKNIAIKARVGKQPYEIVTDLEETDLTQYEIVIIGVGNNGLVRKNEFDQIVKELDNKQIIFITTAVELAWKVPSNNLLKEYDKNNKNISIFDWDIYVNQHPNDGLLEEDGIHLTLKGQEEYTQLLKEVIEK
ncbi:MULTISPECIES: acyltransferase family protein [Vagococcus]|uniref:Lipopolysaccharide modification acyltransferase n=1 Tax=Vagococcus fluvialis bH819 TaxID=1255619 RepID=A0A1X6WPF2_9ENTE|nr:MULTISPECIES: acyltransferase family protein [Vagococcus]SLM86159.1 Lipopolysaccharide modification acyltransferase [Vagococcus fluvialis bH819]